MELNERERRAILTICLSAAFADGGKDEREREQIKRIAESLEPAGPAALPAIYQDVLLKRNAAEEAARILESSGARQLAYEMAVCVCDADGARVAAEAEFLERLRAALGLEAAAAGFAAQADGLAGAPLEAAAPPPPDLERMILNYSILNGALELLPQTLASMAILPLQTKMVYRIGKAYGYELDRGHIKDFAATLGVGFTGQYVEQIGRKLVRGLLGAAGGGLLGGLGSAATGAAFSFATTYALGQVAVKYYSGGRTIGAGQLKEVFASLFEQGKTLQTRHAAEIAERARTFDPSRLADLIRQA